MDLFWDVMIWGGLVPMALIFWAIAFGTLFQLLDDGLKKIRNHGKVEAREIERYIDRHFLNVSVEKVWELHDAEKLDPCRLFLRVDSGCVACTRSLDGTCEEHRDSA